MEWSAITAVNLMFDILLCCVLLVVLWRVERGIKPLRSRSGAASKPHAGGWARELINRRFPGKRKVVPKTGSANRYGEVAALAAQGLSRDAIARKLGLPVGEINLVLAIDQSKDDET